jgi:hypothetical protein
VLTARTSAASRRNWAVVRGSGGLAKGGESVAESSVNPDRLRPIGNSVQKLRKKEKKR